MITSLILFLKRHPGIVTFIMIIITLVTFLITLIPSKYINTGGIWQYDKLGHVAIFGGWTFLFGLQRLLQIDKTQKLNSRLIFLAGILFGSLIELLQYLLPVNRNADLMDILFDAIGCGIALILLKYLATLINSYSE